MNQLQSYSLRVLAVSGVLGVSVLSAGCTAVTPSQPSTPVVPTTVTTTVSASPTTTAPAGVAPLGDASLTEKTQRPQAPSQMVVKNVRVGAHQGFDRVVFDLSGSGTPGWFVAYQKQPVAQGSGLPVTVRGDTFLSVNIDGVAYPFEVDVSPKLHHVPETPGAIVEEVKDNSVFEARNQFYIGIKGGERPFSVEMLQNPPRLVVDIRTQ